MRTPRSLALLSAAVAAGLIVLVGAAPPASAGGPTSVLVVDYAGSRAGAALTGSAAYADLEKALSPYEPPSGDRTAPASFMGTNLRLTWLIHDVTPWRIDAVTVDGTDVWVETTMSVDGSTDLFSAPSVRHRATDAPCCCAPCARSASSTGPGRSCRARWLRVQQLRRQPPPPTAQPARPRRRACPGR